MLHTEFALHTLCCKTQMDKMDSLGQVRVDFAFNTFVLVVVIARGTIRVFIFEVVTFSYISFVYF